MRCEFLRRKPKYRSIAPQIFMYMNGWIHLRTAIQRDIVESKKRCGRSWRECDMGLTVPVKLLFGSVESKCEFANIQNINDVVPGLHATCIGLLSTYIGLLSTYIGLFLSFSLSRPQHATHCCFFIILTRVTIRSLGCMVHQWTWAQAHDFCAKLPQFTLLRSSKWCVSLCGLQRWIWRGLTRQISRGRGEKYQVSTIYRPNWILFTFLTCEWHEQKQTVTLLISQHDSDSVILFFV